MDGSSSFLSIKAVPNAAKNAIVGWSGEVLRVKVQAPPVDGRANEELCRYLADTLDVPRRNVTVVQGESSRLKRLRVAGLSATEITTRLQRQLPGS